ncbi:MAG: coproporphyrinogen dehydrogenase HemZ [Clostridiales Family XIII bacterium]|jgi:oxygen-independent coproporphyrinogen-3 oxidase|nr:coproporphyrinogen dehydrogenase HemZ [Clostridiales Family XIII bacterium]
MFRFRIGAVTNPNEYEELARMFLRNPAFELDFSGAPIADHKDRIKRILYGALSDATGRTLPWGVLTGVKPLKLFTQLVSEAGGEIGASRMLREEYFVSEEKVLLLEDTYRVYMGTLRAPAVGKVGVYVGIPFCPSRCAYCSFTSNEASEVGVRTYLNALFREIEYVGLRMAESGMSAESIYIGGGTPTTLSPGQMEALLSLIHQKIPGSGTAELTVEAGRPETLSPGICRVLTEGGVRRICINPQTLNDETLTRIGRWHDSAAVTEAFLIARDAGFPVINSDIIAGLPGENADDFAETLEQMLRFGPENITVHTLSVKKGSVLRDSDGEFCYNIKSYAKEMVDGLPGKLAASFYRPYYLYRQKQMLDNLENVGYALPGTECVYNMRIMEERQTIIALGAGGSSKVYFPQENRIERVFNVSNYEQYIDRIDEMMGRKEKGIFSC